MNSDLTPSFTVSEEKGFFHCFGCGAHGDVVATFRPLPGPDPAIGVQAVADALLGKCRRAAALDHDDPCAGRRRDFRRLPQRFVVEKRAVGNDGLAVAKPPLASCSRNTRSRAGMVPSHNG